MKPLPTDVDALRSMLKKLKHEEAMLQADLALKEVPEMEEGIVELVKAFVNFEKLDESVLAICVSKAALSGPVDNSKQIAYFEKRLEQIKSVRGDTSAIEARIHILKSRTTRTFDKDVTIIGDRNRAYQHLKLVYHKWKQEFEDCGVDLDYLMPNVPLLLKRGEV